MKRHEFLSLALGATLAALIVPAKAPAAESLSRAKTLEIIYTGLSDMAFDYVSGDKEERQIIIEQLNKIIADMRSETAREAMTEFRDGLLSYSLRTEVRNGKTEK